MAIKILKPPRQNTFICCSLKESRRPPAGSAAFARCKQIQIGAKDGVIARGLIYFGLLPLPASVTIIRATLNLYLTENHFAGRQRILEIFQILSRWNACRVNWKNRPLVAQRPVDVLSVTNQEHCFLVADITPLMLDWQTNQAANFGVMLKMRDEFADNRIAVAGRKIKNSRLWPFIRVEYSDCGGGSPVQPLELAVEVATDDDIAATAPLNVLIFEYSYIPVNTGTQPARCYLQTSSDSVHWQTEGEVKIIQPGKSVSFVPDTISKYSRLCYQSAIAGAGTTLTVNIQGRA